MSSKKPTIHNFNNENCVWIFISGSNEERHINDNVLGIDCLRSKGVKDKDIYVFDDHPQRDIHYKLFGFSANLHPTKEIRQVLRSLSDYQYAFTTVGGHGSEAGIAVNGNPIKPETLVRSIRLIPDIQAGVLVLAQCYAGLFNFINAGGTEPQLAVLGATNLNKSLSDPIQLTHQISRKDGENLDSWAANIFLLYLMLWLKNPIDVDGDKEVTLMDAFKFSGVKTNDHLVGLKRRVHFEIESMKSLFMKEVSQAPQTPDLKQLLQLHSRQKLIQLSVDNLYLHQEPWILHSNFARNITFWN